MPLVSEDIGTNGPSVGNWNSSAPSFTIAPVIDGGPTVPSPIRSVPPAVIVVVPE